MRKITLRDLRRLIGPLVALAVATAAVLSLRHLLREYQWADILREFESHSWEQIGTAAVLTVLGYAVLSGYDLLALYHVLGRAGFTRERTITACLSSFVAYVFSHNFGFTLLTALPVRIRLYGRHGIGPGKVAQIFTFTTLTFFVGLLAVGGAIFVLDPPPVPPMLHLPGGSLRVAGLVSLAVIAVYFAASWTGRARLTLHGHEVGLPTPIVCAGQVGVSALDWALVGSVMWVLLDPAGRPHFMPFLAMFLLAQTAGYLSHVPGGVGVFEAIMLFFLTPRISGDAVAGSLLAYRVTYYLCPLVVGLLLFGLSELNARRKRPAIGVAPDLVEPAQVAAARAEAVG